MSYNQSYESYLSNLDSLAFDSSSEIIQTEKDVADELDLWSNAQFTFDIKPGVGIYDDEKSKSNSPSSQFESASGFDPVTYDTLVNYLDYELPRQQQAELDEPVKPTTALKPVFPVPATTTASPHVKRIQPRPLAPALPVLAPAIAPAPRQVLMPKPPAINPTILASLLATATTKTTTNITERKKSVVAVSTPAAPVVTGVKRAATDDESEEENNSGSEENANPDEDKRRRNTAASARFRIKKKVREQAMEQSVREMTVKSDKLQDRVNHLEAEIKFLRNLLLDKAASDKLAAALASSGHSQRV